MQTRLSCLLLVEDDAAEGARTRRNLKLSRLELGDLVVAASLSEALSAVAAARVDVILLDLDLGDSRSLDTLRAMRAATDAAIIVLSQSDDEVLGVESLKAGADDFLVKARVTPRCLRASILHSMTRYHIRVTACRMSDKIDRLCRMAGV